MRELDGDKEKLSELIDGGIEEKEKIVWRFKEEERKLRIIGKGREIDMEDEGLKI